jgi:hypothetical protein
MREYLTNDVDGGPFSKGFESVLNFLEEYASLETSADSSFIFNRTKLANLISEFRNEKKKYT